nr:pyridoxamine 5'-phosphate oxidase family protein [Sphingomicrobium lutaoense]
MDAATHDRSSGLHTPVLGTADGDLRIMVLRHVDPDRRCLRFHTDIRSPKVSQIERERSVGLLFYDRKAKLQLRCRGVARIEQEGAKAEEGWRGSDNFARRCYLAPQPPSSIADAPTSNLPPDVEGRRPDDARVEEGRRNFAVLLVRLDEIDWFHLDQNGHRRARLRWNEDGQVESCWIAP